MTLTIECNGLEFIRYPAPKILPDESGDIVLENPNNGWSVRLDKELLEAILES